MGEHAPRAAQGAPALTKPFPAGVIEIRSIRVGVVALRAVHTGFFVAMSRRGHIYGSVSARLGRGGRQRGPPAAA